MRHWKLLTVIVLAGLITGCGDSPEHRISQADLSLKQNQPKKALEFIDSALTDADALAPETKAEMLMQARLIKANAHLAMSQLDKAKNALDLLREELPDDIIPVRAMALWSTRSMDSVLGKTEFTENVELQEDFDNALEIGDRQADLLVQKHKKVIEGELLRARLRLMDVARYERLKKEVSDEIDRRRALEENVDDSSESKSLERYNDRITRLQDQAEKHYSAIMEEDPNHVEASMGYLRLVSAREGWQDLWNFGQQLAEKSDLNAGVVQTLVTSVSQIPEPVKTSAAKLALSKEVLVKVKEDHRNSAPYLLTEARLALQESNTTKALEVLDRVKAANRQDTMETNFLRAWCYTTLKNYERARRILDPMATEASGSPMVHTLRARVLMEMNEPVLAREAVRQALAINPRFTAAIDLQIKIDSMANNPDAVLNVSSRDDPLVNRIQLNRAMAKDDTDKINQLLKRVEGFLPRKDEHLALLIDGYSYLKKYDKTLIYSRDMVKRRPDLQSVHMKYGEAILASFGQQRAIEYLSGIESRFPESGGAVMMLAQLLAQKGDYNEAEDLLLQLIRTKPTADAHIILAQTFAINNRVDDAGRHLDEAINLDPGNPRALGLKARLALFQGKTDEAGKYISQIDETKVDEVLSPTLKAQIYIQKNELDKARNICNLAVARGNADPVLRVLLARIYTIEGKPDDAEVHLLGLARAQPKNPQVYSLLGNFYISNPKFYDKGMTEFKSLEATNHVLARIQLARLMSSRKKNEEAIFILGELLNSLIEAKDEQAFQIANTMASIYLVDRKLQPAREVFDRLVAAGIAPKRSKLKQIDYSWMNPSKFYTTNKLKELAGETTKDDPDTRSKILARLARLEEHQQAIDLIDAWVKGDENNATLYRWKAQLLGALGKYDESIVQYKTAIQKAPKELGLRVRLVATHLANHDHPAAEEELLAMTSVDESAKALALAELGQMYVNLGLYEQAITTFNHLERISKVHEPRVIYAMGRALSAMDLNDQARIRLAKVPQFAKLYPNAQVELAKIEVQAGHTNQARDRVASLVTDPRLRSRAMVDLLKLNPYDKSDKQIIEWADSAMSFELVPNNLKARWLSIRVRILDQNAKDTDDYKALLAALKEWQELEPRNIRLISGQMAIHALLEQRSEARKVFESVPQLANTGYGPLLAIVVGLEPKRVEQRAPLPEYFVGLATGKPEMAQAAVDALETRVTLYRNDLSSVLKRPDLSDPKMLGAARQMATAMVALDAGLPKLCAVLSKNLMEYVPTLAPAHGLHAQALLNMNEDIDAALKLAKDSVPSAGITQYLQAEADTKAKNYTSAVTHLRKIVDAEPTNIHAHYRLSQLLQLAGENERAIAELEKLHSQGGSYRIMVANDLSYLVAVNMPDRLGVAYGIANRAFELVAKTKGNPIGASALQDTLGWIEHLRKDDKKAIGLLRQAVRALNDRPEVHYHTGVVYEKLKNSRWAKYHLQKAARGDETLPEVAKAKALLKKLDG